MREDHRLARTVLGPELDLAVAAAAGQPPVRQHRQGLDRAAVREDLKRKAGQAHSWRPRWRLPRQAGCFCVRSRCSPKPGRRHARSHLVCLPLRPLGAPAWPGAACALYRARLEPASLPASATLRLIYRLAPLHQREPSNRREDERNKQCAAENEAPSPLTRPPLVPRALHQLRERRFLDRQLVIPLQQLFSLSQKPVRQRVVIHTLAELVDQPAIGGVLSEPGLQRQLWPVVDHALMGEFDRAVLGRQQAGIDQTADDTIRRLRQRCARTTRRSRRSPSTAPSSTRMR